MKYAALVPLATALTLGLAASAAGEEAPVPAPVPAVVTQAAVRAEAPVKIDGVLDEPCWARAPALRADYVHGKTAVTSAAPRLLVRAAWDEYYLYLAYETFDTNLVAIGSGRSEAGREGLEIFRGNLPVDVVEFFVSLGDRRFFWEVHHNASNQFNDVWCTALDPSWPVAKATLYRWGIVFSHESTLQGDCDVQPACAAVVKAAAGEPSTINDNRDCDAGYIAELRLPWYGLAAPDSARRPFLLESGKPDTKRAARWEMAGAAIRMLTVVQDGDLVQRYHHSSSTLPGGWFHHGWDYWPVYRLEP